MLPTDPSPAAMPESQDRRVAGSEGRDRSPGGVVDAADDDLLLERSRRLRNIQAPIMFLIAAGAVLMMTVVAGVGMSVYGLIAVSYLAVKLGLSLLYRPSAGDFRRVGTVAAGVPFYNEDPAACEPASRASWPREVVEENLEAYTHQTFLGIPVMYGDDRRLTNYALTSGKVLFQDTAIAYTTVPDRFTHFARQQLRWNKSFFRETLWALGAFRPWNRVWLLSFAELGLWLAFSVSLVALVVVYPLVTGELPSPWYLGFVAAMAFARSVRYIGSQRTPLIRQVGVYLLAPLYGLLYLAVLMPIRFWALFSLRNPGWGTRKVVEVEFQGDPGGCSPLRALSDLDGFSAPPAPPLTIVAPDKDEDADADADALTTTRETDR